MVMGRHWLLLLVAGWVTGSAEVVEDAGMVDLQESGGQVVVAGGTVVTLVNAATKCIRKASPGDNLSVHYTGRLGGPGGKVFDTSRNGGDDQDEDGCKDGGGEDDNLTTMEMAIVLMMKRMMNQEGATNAVQVSVGSQ